MQADVETQDTAVMPGPNPNEPGSFWVRHFRPFQISAVSLPTAMQNEALLQDTVFRPIPGAVRCRHDKPFQNSVSAPNRTDLVM
jgi:hypothetical protein